MTNQDGFLILDKPQGLTSQQALNAVKKRLGVRKVGHAGTLDPFATGVLLVAVGQATKFLPYLPLEPKKYRAELKFGEATDSYDRDGAITECSLVPDLTEDILDQALASLLGRRLQQPPVFSAKKHAGRRACDLVRQGHAVKLHPSSVEIFSLRRVFWQKPVLTFDCVVSGGTYVRSLGVEIAEKLHTVGHLVALKRVAVGAFALTQSVQPQESTEKNLIPLAQALSFFPEWDLSAGEAEKILYGQSLDVNTRAPEATIVRLVAEAKFLGLGQLAPQGEWMRLTPIRLLKGHP